MANKNKLRRPCTYTCPPWATWWMRQLISQTRSIVHVLYSSSLPGTSTRHTHLLHFPYFILPSKETSVLFAFFLDSLIFWVNWELVILAFFFQVWGQNNHLLSLFWGFGMSFFFYCIFFFFCEIKREVNDQITKHSSFFCYYYYLCSNTIKGLLHPKMKMLSLFTYPHVIPTP